MTSCIVIRRQKKRNLISLGTYIIRGDVYVFTKTATTDLRQADRPTSDSLEVNLRLALRWRHAYGGKYYADINRFQFGSSSYDSVMHTAPVV